MRTIWFRIGVNMQITESEEKEIFENGNLKAVIEAALKDNRIAPHGDTYIPDPIVELFNDTNGTNYVVKDYDCEL